MRSSAANLFTAFALKERLISLLDPRPLAYP